MEALLARLRRLDSSSVLVREGDNVRVLRAEQVLEWADEQERIRSGAGPIRHVAEKSKRSRQKSRMELWLLAAGALSTLIAISVWGILAAKNKETESLRCEADAVRAVIAETNAWISNGSLDDSDRIEQQIESALAKGIASDASVLEATLTDFRRVKSERLADLKKTRHAQQIAAAFNAAKDAIARKDVVKARSALSECEFSGRDTEFLDKAIVLRIALDHAVSQSDATQTLLKMSDVEFAQFQATGLCKDEQITDPGLRKIHNETVKQCVPIAVKQRKAEAARIAKMKRMDKEQLAEENRKATSARTTDDSRQSQSGTEEREVTDEEAEAYLNTLSPLEKHALASEFFSALIYTENPRYDIWKRMTESKNPTAEEKAKNNAELYHVFLQEVHKARKQIDDERSRLRVKQLDEKQAEAFSKRLFRFIKFWGREDWQETSSMEVNENDPDWEQFKDIIVPAQTCCCVHEGSRNT